MINPLKIDISNLGIYIRNTLKYEIPLKKFEPKNQFTKILKSP